jgi:hypothetical protein
LVDRAGELVEHLGRRQAEVRVAIADSQTAAAARLTEALTAGVARDALPTAPKADALEAAAAGLASRLKVAETALQRLTDDMAAAADRLQRCRNGIARCALAVLVDEAADIAGEILEDAAALDQRRADLDGLARLVTAESRRLNGQPLHLPAPISQALYPADKQLHGARQFAATDWTSAYRALIEGPPPDEADAGPLADSAAAEAP